MSGFESGLVVAGGHSGWWPVDYACLVCTTPVVLGAVWLLKGGSWNDGE